MKYSLRSLMIAVLVLPPTLAATYYAWKYARAHPAPVLLAIGGIALLGRIAMLYAERFRPRP